MVFNNPYKVLYVGKFKDAKTVTIGETDYRFYKSQAEFFPYDTDLDAIKADIDFVVDEMSWSEIASAMNESGFKGNTNRTFSQLITPAILVAGFDKTELAAYLGGGTSVDTYLAEFETEDVIAYVESLDNYFAEFETEDVIAYVESLDNYFAEFDLEDMITFVEGEGYTVVET